MVPLLNRSTGVFSGLPYLCTVMLLIIHSQGFNIDTIYTQITPGLSLILTSPLNSSHIYSTNQLDTLISKSPCSKLDFSLSSKACFPPGLHDFWNITIHQVAQAQNLGSILDSSVSLHTHTNPNCKFNCSYHQNTLENQFLPTSTVTNLVHAINISHWVLHNSLTLPLLSLFQLLYAKHLEIF